MEAQSLVGTRILIIEDEADNAEFLRRVLSHYGAEIHIAEDGDKALAALEAQPFAILLCDLSMPNVDGWQVIQQIRQDARFAALPVIAVTAHALRADQQRAMQAGFLDYVVKPIVDIPAFLALVESALQRAA